MPDDLLVDAERRLLFLIDFLERPETKSGILFSQYNTTPLSLEFSRRLGRLLQQADAR